MKSWYFPGLEELLFGLPLPAAHHSAAPLWVGSSCVALRASPVCGPTYGSAGAPLSGRPRFGLGSVQHRLSVKKIHKVKYTLSEQITWDLNCCWVHMVLFWSVIRHQSWWFIWEPSLSPVFRVQLVESVPVGLYPSSPSSRLSIADSWLHLLKKANKSVDIAAYYFTLRGSDTQTAPPFDSQVSTTSQSTRDCMFVCMYDICISYICTHINTTIYILWNHFRCLCRSGETSFWALEKTWI